MTEMQTAQALTAADLYESLLRGDAPLILDVRNPADFVLSNLPIFPPQYVEIKRVNIGLSHPSEEQAEALELGKNICALSK
jgi:hypothetical protein